MKSIDKPYSRRLEKLIRLVDKEKEAGRLTQQQVKAIANKSLVPLKEKENSLALFMLSGGIDEEVAKACCQLLIEEMKEYLPADSHTHKVIDSMKPHFANMKE